MRSIKFSIDGIPYTKSKKRGDVNGPPKWTDEIVKQTKDQRTDIVATI
jgi:hypothetical protein